MQTVLVSTKRFLQNAFPFKGKIIFALQGTDSSISSILPVVGIFHKGTAIAKLIPNSCINTASYYKYQIFPQGHMPGVYLSEPVEEGYCVVPTYNCFLDNIVTALPTKEEAQDLTAAATDILAELREAIQTAQVCAEEACTCATNAAVNKNTVSSLVQSVQTAQQNIYAKYQAIDQRIEEVLGRIQNQEQAILQEARSVIQNESQNALTAIGREQHLAEDLIQYLQERFRDLSTYESLAAAFQALRTEYEAKITELTNLINANQRELNLDIEDLSSDITGLSADLSALSDQIDAINAQLPLLSNRIDNIADYQGATATADGIHGLVPSALSADKDKFLKGTGEWTALPNEFQVMSASPTASDFAPLANHALILEI